MLQRLVSVLFMAAVASAQFNYALDLSDYGAVSDFNCIKSNRYSAVFIRGYEPTNGGRVDSNVVYNVNNAFNAGLGIEVFITPAPSSSKSAATQIDEAINNLSNNGLTIRSLWVQITSPVNWSTSSSSNANFVLQAVQRIRDRGIRAGIYTNSYDWQQITNNLVIGGDVMLWYWHVYASGVNGESDPNFNDFRSFSGFNSASVKQFGQSESLCNFRVNRDVFPANSVAAAAVLPPDAALPAFAANPKQPEHIVNAKPQKVVIGGVIGF